MLGNPATQIDFRPYAGQHVIIGCAPGEQWKRGVTYYVLGTIVDGELPEHVKAIVVDDAGESSELLFVVIVNEAGTEIQLLPLVVFDDHDKLRYGLEFAHAVVRAKTSSPCYLMKGVPLPT